MLINGNHVNVRNEKMEQTDGQTPDSCFMLTSVNMASITVRVKTAL